jgi:hypothetical protein
MRIFWTPTDTGAFKAWVTVTDGKARDSIAWNIHVVDTVTINHAPIFSALTRQTLESDTVWYKNTQYTRVLSATDKDPDLLIFSVSAPLILSGDVSITWTPTDTGVTKIRAIVSDSKAQDTIEWRMHVIDSTKDTNSINLARGLVAWYPFNGNAKDESGNGNDGTVNGATLTTDRYGASDKAYSFDGVNDNILVAHSTLPKGDNTISYSAWINVNAPLNIYGSVIDAGKPGIRSKRIALHVELDSLIKFTGQNNDYRFDQAPIKSNRWYHVFIQKINRNVSLYLNGTFIYTATLSEDITLDTTTITIGSNGGAWAAGDQFKGSIDDIRIYSRRLYKGEIDSLYREGGLGWQNDTIKFLQATASAAFPKRDRPQGVVFNNQMWIIAGRGQNSGAGQVNDIWRSSNGITWTQATASANFSARWGHRCVFFKNKIWLTGGADNTGALNDVWSSTDGTTWTLALNSAAFPQRYSHSMTAYDNKLWIIGGFDGAQQYRNDVWYSSDGTTWTLATATANFSGRSSHTCIEYNGKMWVAGGFNGTQTTNDVWSSSDGITWTQATASAAFSSRSAHAAVVYKDKMWIISGGSVSDIWNSSDGISWKEITHSAAFPQRSEHTSFVFNDKIWVIAGYSNGNITNDVWYGE